MGRGEAMGRRRFLAITGSSVLGVAVLGTTTGCASSGDSTTGPPSTTPAADPTGTATGAATPGSELEWRRVDQTYVSAYLLVRGAEIAIVDLGFSQARLPIETALTAAGAGWEAVRNVVLTHHHDDHAGGVRGVAALVDAEFYAGREDVEAISSPEPLTPLEDDDEVFGLRIIATPGHTPGHISVFDEATGVLVAGDALRTTEGLAGSDPQYTADAGRAAASVAKLAALEPKIILPGHGEPITTGAAEALRSLAATL